MGIGVSIFLIALGAIIAFGVQAELGWLDLDVVGWVLMLAGVTGLVLTFYFWNRRRRATTLVDERHYHDDRVAPAPRTTETAVRRDYPPPHTTETTVRRDVT